MRRRTVCVVALVALAGLVGCHPVEPDGTHSDTTQVDVAHTAVSSTTISSHAKVRWTHDFGPNAVVAAPLIVGDLVISGAAFGTGGLSPSDANATRVVGLDRETGTVRWTQLIGHEDSVGLTTAGGRLFALVNHRLYAFDLTTGQPLWDVADLGPHHSAPTASGRDVFVASYPHTGGELTSYDAATGAVRWSVDAETIDGARSTPAVTSTAVYLGGVCGQTIKYRRSDGARLWRNPGPCYGGGGANTVVRGNLVYTFERHFGGTSVGYVLNEKTGKPTNQLATTSAPVVGRSNTLFIEADGMLTNRSVDTKTIRWKVPSTEATGYPIAQPVVADDTVFTIRSADGTARTPQDASTLVGYRVVDGTERVRIPTGPWTHQLSGQSIAVAQHALAFNRGTTITLVA